MCGRLAWGDVMGSTDRTAGLITQSDAAWRRATTDLHTHTHTHLHNTLVWSIKHACLKETEMCHLRKHHLCDAKLQPDLPSVQNQRFQLPLIMIFIKD